MYSDSVWGYASIAVSDPSEGVSDWGYATTSIVDPGKPNLMIAGQEADIRWNVMKGGVSVPVLRWAVMQGGNPTTLSSSHNVGWVPSSYTAGADAVGSMQYTVPGSNVIYLATNGSDSNGGTTVGAPKATLAAALAAVPTGGTIVIRAGVYHQGEIETSKSCTIQNYPGEAVWFDGATVKTGWTNNGNGTWSTPYSLTYDRNLGKTSAQIAFWTGPATRVIVDQVWLDNTKLSPVADATTPGAGQFSVNQSTDTLTIGSDPSGKTARIVDLKYLIGGTNLTIRGIGVRRYAPAMIEWRSCAVNLGVGSTVEQVNIEHISLDALSIGGTGCIVRRCTFQDTGHSGAMSDNPAGMIFECNIIRRVNRNLFDPEPTTAGFKITRCFAGLTIRFNHIEDVPNGSGIWFDTTVSRSAIYGNTIIGTSSLGSSGRMKSAISIEGSDGGVYGGTQYYTYIVGNRILDVRISGIIICDSGWIKCWNNDVSAAVCLYVWQDYRENTGSMPSTEGTIEQSPWHCQNVEFVNNNLMPESLYYTQLRLQCNSDAAFKIAGGAMLSRLAYNWFRPQGSGLMAYISDAAGASWSTRSTLSALATTSSTYGGPLDGIMSGNYQGNSAPTGTGMAMQPDVAAACGIPASHVPSIGAIWPAVTPAN